MAKKTEQEKYAELMEMKTNKAAKQIVHVITSSDLNPTASIVSIVKATAILLESFNAVGENAEYLEMIVKNMPEHLHGLRRDVGQADLSL